MDDHCRHRSSSAKQPLTTAMLFGALLTTLLAAGAAVCAPSSARSPALPTRDARFSVPAGNLSSAIACQRWPDGTRHVVLLVHGTALNAASWHSGPYWHLLPSRTSRRSPRGYDVCSVDLPHNALGDAQVNAEYVAHAVQQLSAKSRDGKITAVGHSQGGGLNVPWARCVTCLLCCAVQHHDRLSSYFPPGAASFGLRSDPKCTPLSVLRPTFTVRVASCARAGSADTRCRMAGTNFLPGPACLVETVASLGAGCAASFLQQQQGSAMLNAQLKLLTQALVPTSASLSLCDHALSALT